MREDFDIRLDDGEVQAAFNRLLRAGQDLTPAPRALPGEHICTRFRVASRYETELRDGRIRYELHEVE